MWRKQKTMNKGAAEEDVKGQQDSCYGTQVETHTCESVVVL
jgi:hypothetical protein